MLVNGLFLFDRMKGVLHLAYLLDSFVPDMCRIELMVVYFLGFPLCFLDSVWIVRYIQLNIMLVSGIVLYVMPNPMPLLDHWRLLLFFGMVSCGVVVFCLIPRLMPQFFLLCVSNGSTVFLLVALLILFLHMRSPFR